MRISQHRYARDRAGLDLALRMKRHGALHYTIRAWTGLTEDRVRKLSRSYVQPPESARRGRVRFRRSDNVEVLLQPASNSFEASALASVFSLLNLVPRKPDQDAA